MAPIANATGIPHFDAAPVWVACDEVAVAAPAVPVPAVVEPLPADMVFDTSTLSVELLTRGVWVLITRLVVLRDGELEPLLRVALPAA